MVIDIIFLWECDHCGKRHPKVFPFPQEGQEIEGLANPPNGWICVMSGETDGNMRALCFVCATGLGQMLKPRYENGEERS